MEEYSKSFRKYPARARSKRVREGGTSGASATSVAMNTVVNNVASAGHAETARDLDPDSPVYERVLRKDQEDGTAHKLHLDGGAEFGTFAAGSTGAAVWEDVQGQWHGEVDHLHVRRKLAVEEVEIMETSHIGGKIVNTCASLRVERVEFQGSYYRLYFRSVDGEGRRIDNLWRVGDQALCQTFNLVDSTGQSANHYWWRLVVGTSGNMASEGTEHWIDVSNVREITATGGGGEPVTTYGYAIGSDAPMAGDEAVQLGCRTDASRTGAIVQSPQGNGAPYLCIYRGITGFSLPAPLVKLSPEETLITAQAINLVATAPSGVEVVDLQGYVDGLYNRVGTLEADVDDMARRGEDSFVVWHGETTDAPTLANAPASEWVAVADGEHDTMEEHAGDFYLTSDGLCYRFAEDDEDGYGWVPVSDRWLIAYVQQIGEVQAYIAKMGDDGVVTPAEKLAVRREWQAAQATYTAMRAETADTAITDVIDGAMGALRTVMTAVLANMAAESAVYDEDGLPLIVGYNAEQDSYVGFSEAWTQWYAAAANARSTIKLTADRIVLEGLVTANQNFRVLTDGSIEARNGTFRGTIVAEKTYTPFTEVDWEPGETYDLEQMGVNSIIVPWRNYAEQAVEKSYIVLPNPATCSGLVYRFHFFGVGPIVMPVVLLAKAGQGEHGRWSSDGGNGFVNHPEGEANGLTVQGYMEVTSIGSCWITTGMSGTAGTANLE